MNFLKKFCSLFFHPYTKIEYIERDMMVGRKTAAKYFDMIVELNLLDKIRVKKDNYYINSQLIDLLLNYQSYSNSVFDTIESVHKID